ncbi:hypothetical protein B0T11DRAFT_110919 [Plectosphaerella cucumerina]|uniref:Uncharacterized protein n=1 Tax=Plectosphaerella cucumerina TaxID=40658 RepID=A0A8K0TDN4_9PEZI|nr:hypothetical protein B0T11DRAFT_110919 [Plectosphaerella cucumerina]
MLPNTRPLRRCDAVVGCPCLAGAVLCCSPAHPLFLHRDTVVVSRSVRRLRDLASHGTAWEIEVVLGLPLHLLQPVVQTPPPSGCISRPASSPSKHLQEAHQVPPPPIRTYTTKHSTPPPSFIEHTAPVLTLTLTAPTSPARPPNLARLLSGSSGESHLPSSSNPPSKPRLIGINLPGPKLLRLSVKTPPNPPPLSRFQFHLHFCLSRPCAIQPCFQPLTTSTRRICLGFDTLYTTQDDYRNPDCRRHRLRLSPLPRCCHNTLVILPTHQPYTPKEPSEPRIFLQHHL